MKAPMRTAHTIVLLLLLAVSASAQRPDARVRRIVVAAGTVQGNTYVNKSIGVSYEFPAGWRVQTPALPPRFLDHPAPLLRAEPDAPGNVFVTLLILPLTAITGVPADERRDPSKFIERWAHSSKDVPDARL